MQIEKLHPLFAARLTGLDLRTPLDSDEFELLNQAQDRFGLLLFPDQPLSDAQLLAFAGQFGPLQTTALMGDAENHLIRVTNLDTAGNILPKGDGYRARMEANRLWHTDSTYLPVRATLSMLLARIVPPSGGETEFCDTRVAYESLTEQRKAGLGHLVARHSLAHSRRLTGFSGWTAQELQRLPPPVPRSLVQRHEGSGRNALCLASHIESVDGMTNEQAEALLAELTERATEPPHVYRHRWSVSDLLIWDNRCTMHRLCPYDEYGVKRQLVSTRVLDTGNRA